MQRQSLKLKIRLKKDKNGSNSSTITRQPNNTEQESNISNTPLKTFTSGDQFDLNSNPRTPNSNDQENPSPENAQNQLVIYDPTANFPTQNLQTPPLRKPHPFSDRTPRVLPAIGAFTVQCASCFKWRLIPSKEKYEEIREKITEIPFLCESAREWHADMSCDDPPDIVQDDGRLWAIDKPNIAQPPQGWQRLLRIRGEGGSKFADVYYVAPSGKRLRSTLDIQRYLTKHPEYVHEGFNLSQFSFLTPKPLQEDYVRKRPSRPVSSGSLDPPEENLLTWHGHDVDTDLHLSGPGLSYSHSPPVMKPENQSKQKRAPSKRRSNGDLVYDQNVINLD